MLKRLLKFLVAGIVLVIAGASIVSLSFYSESKTIRHIGVNEASTDWYSTGSISALRGDQIEINVDSTGGSSKLRVDNQAGTSVFPEVQNSHLQYSIAIISTDTYSVIIWTRAWPWPSNYVNLKGSVDLNRVVSEISPTAYAGIASILIGILLMITGSASYFYNQRQKNEEKKFRICPGCKQKTPIIDPVCLFCGFDIYRSVRCEYCHSFFDRSLTKCPNCGAKQSH